MQECPRHLRKPQGHKQLQVLAAMARSCQSAREQSLAAPAHTGTAVAAMQHPRAPLDLSRWVALGPLARPQQQQQEPAL